MELSNKKVMEIASKFAIKGEIKAVEKYGNGHINRTYLIITDSRKYILQRINSSIFTNVEGLMNNIVRVTEHLKENNVNTLSIIPTFDAKLYYKDGEDYYRIYKAIQDTYCFEGIDNIDVVRKAGYAFGQLHGNLADLDPSGIVDVIPGFHDTEKRYKKLLKAISIDPVGRAESVKEIIDFVNEHKDDYSILINSIKDGSIHNAITHNDPKINNVLFDKETLEVKCVIDLDTVMTGSVLFDFGDALRSLFTGANEDNKDLSLINVDFDVYKAYLEGYYSQMKNVLNEKEISLFPMSVIILTMELVIRFLTDYIEGDIYFATNYPEHNLDRTRTQYKLARELYKNLDKLNQITEEVCK